MAAHPMAELRKKLQEKGLLDKPTMKSWIKIISLLTLLAFMYTGHIFLPLKWGLLLLPITALFTTTVAMIGHEGVHSAACKSKLGNISLAAVAFPLFSGLSMEYWREKHNRYTKRNIEIKEMLNRVFVNLNSYGCESVTLTENFAVVCLESIDDLDERELVVKTLVSTNKEIIEISTNQKLRFASRGIRN